MKIYNTLTGKKENLIKTRNRPLKLFVCGSTVYDYAHIGHARTYLSFDIIVRYLRSQGLRVFYLQNITDIDDKIIDRARRDNKNPESLARFFEKEYLKDMKVLGINSVDKYARASDFIPQIVRQVKTLIKKGNAYKIEDDGYYFDLSTFPAYGKLSKRTVRQAQDAVSRIDESVRKRNKGDFCLWKFYKVGEPYWDSPLGEGRPGWHIEDTAITEKYFGPQYDIHGGAVDLKFPHHEAEIAQQESASGKKPFVKIWIHTGFLLVNGEKMSKSLGNFITIKGFLKKNPPEILRWIVLSHHYRSPINYTPALVNQARSSLSKIREFLDKLEMASRFRKKEGLNIKMENRLKEAGLEMRKAMDDDMNTPFVIAHIFRLGLEFQNKIWRLKSGDARKLHQYITSVLKILGVNIKPQKIPTKIKGMAQKREIFRVNKQFIQADTLRKKIEALGYKVEDTPYGPKITATRY